ncbi:MULTISPECIES: hypothetical protein [unclassified Streptomyces]|uniref:hypothetical protein n=1 Tax=unclassified Streptomyces TaxID=2593676 RepID=UPI0007EDEB63|nr:MULTISPECIES: hypothetical protein [unclassified Streptomyces]MCP3768803.1 hypothetical protein [Streptomyces sp. MAR25Y5]OBQ48658.1 hypothetical protein A4U61_26715 [Streptomyces sp. H-KF8]
MKCDDLASALGRDRSTSARAARAALRAGAEFKLSGSRTVSARLLRTNWSHRHRTMPDTGVTPRPGPAEAVHRLYAAGTDHVSLAAISGAQRRFTVFLSEDLTRCVACMG